jgi:hypothetical protein
MRRKIDPVLSDIRETSSAQQCSPAASIKGRPQQQQYRGMDGGPDEPGVSPGEGDPCDANGTKSDLRREQENWETYGP